MRDKRKIQILSSWTKPPFEAPQGSPSPHSTTRQKKQTESKTKRSAPPFLSSCHRRRSGSLMPLLLLLPLSCRPACLRLGVVSARAYKDVDAHTPAPGYISPGWDAASGPGSHLLLPLPFPSLPLHLLPSLFRLTTGRIRCRWGRLDRFGRDARPCMLGMHESVRRGGIPHMPVGEETWDS
jgi:hypothetical protein